MWISVLRSKISGLSFIPAQLKPNLQTPRLEFSLPTPPSKTTFQNTKASRKSAKRSNPLTNYGPCREESQADGHPKPVIYLFLPKPAHIVVRVSLVKAWSFSAVYPSVTTRDSDFGESIAWDVNPREDHTMTENSSDTRVSYLFWEAEPKPGVVSPSPLTSPQGTIAPFDSSSPQITNMNSVVIGTPNSMAYLDNALSALGLHVEARTSFITYWLPSNSKHEYIALTFLSQSLYEQAAPFEVEPKPDIVTRVFMLSKRVCEDELDE